VDNDSNKMQQSRPQLRVITDFSAHQPTSKAKPRLIKANHPVTSAPIDPYSPSSGGKPEYSCTRTPKLHLHHPIPHHHHFYAATHHGNFDADADLAMIVQTAPPPLMSRDFPVLNSLPPRPPASLSFCRPRYRYAGNYPVQGLNQPPSQVIKFRQGRVQSQSHIGQRHLNEKAKYFTPSDKAP